MMLLTSSLFQLIYLGGKIMSRMIDETGKVYNRLTVIERDYSKTNASKTVYWKCQCECGNFVSFPGTKLRNGVAKSCGCLRNEKLSQLAKQNHKVIDETGKQYGKLTVIELVTIDKKQGAFWKCKCECGTIVIVRGTQLRSGKTSSCGCLTSKGEENIKRFLNKHNIAFVSQKTFDNCRFPETQALAKFDFYLPDINLLIEYDGPQHFFYTENNKIFTKEKFAKIQLYDNYKDEYCKKNSIPLLRIKYNENIEEKLAFLLQ